MIAPINNAVFILPDTEARQQVLARAYNVIERIDVPAEWRERWESMQFDVTLFLAACRRAEIEEVTIE